MVREVPCHGRPASSGQRLAQHLRRHDIEETEAPRRDAKDRHGSRGVDAGHHAVDGVMCAFGEPLHVIQMWQPRCQANGKHVRAVRLARVNLRRPAGLKFACGSNIRLGRCVAPPFDSARRQ
jgi:hypothetical protein